MAKKPPFELDFLGRKGPARGAPGGPVGGPKNPFTRPAGFRAQIRLDELAARRAIVQGRANQRAVEAKKELAERGTKVDLRKQQTPEQLLVTRKFGVSTPRSKPLEKVSERLVEERVRPLQTQRRKAQLQERRSRRATSTGPADLKTFAPVRLGPDQVEQTVTKFARPVTAQDVRRGRFLAITPENAPEQELEARLAQVGVRERTMNFKAGEPIGFQRTVFSFVNPPTRGGSLILTVTEVPANNPQGKMVFVSSQRPGGEATAFLVDSRLSALRVVDQVRETASKVSLPPLEEPSAAVRFGQGRFPRQVVPRPSIPLDQLEVGRIIELPPVPGGSIASTGGSSNPFVKNPSMRTAVKLLMGVSDLAQTGFGGALRGVVTMEGDVVLFPSLVFHESGMAALGLEEVTVKFVLERSRQGFKPFFDLPNEGRRQLRDNKVLRRLIRPEVLRKMLGPRISSSPRPTSPATTPRKPIL